MRQTSQQPQQFWHVRHFFNVAIKVCTLGACILGVSACSLTSTQTGSTEADNIKTAAAAKPAASARYAEFEPTTLYSLLVAEIAAQRGMERIALHNYIQQAELTRDIGVVQRAAYLSSQLENQQSLLRAINIWNEIEPDNPTPNRIATRELIRQGQYQKAIPLLGQSLELEVYDVFDMLANRANKMTNEERDAYLAELDALLTTAPNDQYLLYTKASLLVYEDKLTEALQLTQQALNSAPDYDRAVLLEADLQSRTGHIDTALGHLREQLSQRDHKQIRVLYTRLLLENEQYSMAEQQADILALNYTDDHNLLFYLGVLMFEHKRLDASEQYFSLLSDYVGVNSSLNYYNGRIAEMRGHPEQALEYFLNVDEAPYLVASFNATARLLDQPADKSQITEIFTQGRQDHPDAEAILYSLESAWLIDHDFKTDALAVLNEAVDAYPDNFRLRYNRGMMAQEQGDIDQMEADMLYLLAKDPDNATLLNTLGYSLTDNTDRHHEAFEYIMQAHEIKPEDPAILDSLGWVYYNLGQLDMALKYLLQAYQRFPDPEIAAHLGIVYWETGQQDKAQAIWAESLKDNPDHPLLIDAQRRAQGSQGSNGS